MADEGGRGPGTPTQKFQIDISEIATLIKISDEVGADISEGRRLLLIAINMGKTSKNFDIIAKYLSESRTLMESAIEEVMVEKLKAIQQKLDAKKGILPSELGITQKFQATIEYFKAKNYKVVVQSIRTIMEDIEIFSAAKRNIESQSPAPAAAAHTTSQTPAGHPAPSSTSAPIFPPKPVPPPVPAPAAAPAPAPARGGATEPASTPSVSPATPSTHPPVVQSSVPPPLPPRNPPASPIPSGTATPTPKPDWEDRVKPHPPPIPHHQAAKPPEPKVTVPPPETSAPIGFKHEALPVDVPQPAGQPVSAPAPAKQEYRVEKTENPMKCSLCMGKIKPGISAIICKCGAASHEACGRRAGKCPTCGTAFA